MLAYAALLLGARRLAIKAAIRFWSGASGPGNRIMSGSANKLKRNSSTSSPVVGPPRFKKRTPSPLLLLSSVSVWDAMDGVGDVDDSEIPVAALSSVVLLSFLLFVDVVVVVNLLSEDDGGVAKSRVDVLTPCSHPLLQSISVCIFEWDEGCRLALGIKAVAVS